MDSRTQVIIEVIAIVSVCISLIVNLGVFLENTDGDVFEPYINAKRIILDKLNPAGKYILWSLFIAPYYYFNLLTYAILLGIVYIISYIVIGIKKLFFN